MSTETAVPNTNAPARSVARWEDFIDIFFSPRELFQRRANDSWVVPIVVLAVVSMVVYYAFMPVNRVVMETAMLNNPSITDEQRAQAASATGVIQIIWGVMVPVFIIIMTLVTGLFAWLAGKMTSIDLPFRRALMITAFVGCLTFVQQMVAYLLMALKLRSGEEINVLTDGSAGVLRLVDVSEMSPALVGLLSRLDVFAVWQMLWFAIAFMVAAKAPRSGAWIAAIVVWLVGAVPVIMQAAGQQ